MKTLIRTLAVLLFASSGLLGQTHAYQPPSGKPLSPAQTTAIARIEARDGKKITPPAPESPEAKASRQARELENKTFWANVEEHKNDLSPSSPGTANGVGLGLGILALLGLGSFVYFIPSFVAMGNHHRNTAAIAVLNLFLGWSVIGWVIALVWAVKKDPVVVARP